MLIDKQYLIAHPPPNNIINGGVKSVVLYIVHEKISPMNFLVAVNSRTNHISGDIII